MITIFIANRLCSIWVC